MVEPVQRRRAARGLPEKVAVQNGFFNGNSGRLPAFNVLWYPVPPSIYSAPVLSMHPQPLQPPPRLCVAITCIVFVHLVWLGLLGPLVLGGASKL